MGEREPIETALAPYLVMAWRINRLMRIGRTLTKLLADVLLGVDEWKATAYVLNKKPMPKKTPALREVIRLTAQLGASWAARATGSQERRRGGWLYVMWPCL